LVFFLSFGEDTNIAKAPSTVALMDLSRERSAPRALSKYDELTCRD
jgi:hypothetical protein